MFQADMIKTGFAISANKMVELVPFLKSMNVLDVSTGAGVIAIKKAKEKGLKNIIFNHSDVKNISYDEQLFDVVT